jgi:methyl-accepting chemotaxis protein
VQEVLAGAPLSQQVLIGKTSGKPSFVMSAPISAGSTTAGVIAIAMTIAEMSKQVIQSSIGETGHAFLVDRDGKVIAHQSEQFIKSRHDLSTNPAILASKWGENRLVYTNEDGKKIIAFTLQTERGWTMVVEQEYKEAFAALTQLNHRTVLLLVATVIPVVLITFMLSRSFSVPIRKLTEITNAISMGDLKVRIREVSRGDEIGVLAGAIDRLRTSTELAMGRLKQ